ncbi:putative membrane protein YdfJ with MMPL/SSD domain [Streptomyces sp. V4I23]|uniref:MMPL family transporter n=1 Tax=Streptomyces sp. V4I23 TaxID=3042282 RepID=UPI00278245CC|nr:MMPL family transporter [Streptomyces sp. V4I23]MDQ1006044.1 putative membrane protein YdfJ with MMPL/SSD domain [Streptomyces sp. V4I23]
MFARLGGLVVRMRWVVIALAIGVVAFGAIWGTRVTDSLSDGGFYPDNGPSAKADHRIEQEFGRQNADVVVLYSSDRHTMDDPEFTEPVSDALSALDERPEVADVRSFFTTKAPDFVSEDSRSTFATISLTGTDEKTRNEQYEELREILAVPETTTLVGGREAALAEFNKKTEEGILTAEIIATPILTVLMLIIFGGVVAACMPMVVGVLAVLGGFVITRLLTYVLDVSVFAINVITIIGLGLAIDYSLFIVSRFREEMRAGADERTAIVRTMSTAGRTVVVSGSTVLLALAGLLIIPLPFLHGIALGGGAAIGVAIISALIVLPAVLAVLGKRVDALKLPGRLGRRRNQDVAGGDELGFWARIGSAVMRRPVVYLVGVLAVLIVAAVPFAHATFETVDERVLPEGTQSRVVSERLKEEFPGGADGTLLLMVDGGGKAAAQTVSTTVEGMDHVVSVTPVAANADATLLQVKSSSGEQGPGTRELAEDLSRLTPPDGSTLHVTGLAAQVNDQMDAIADGLPWLALVVVGVTLVMLFFAFGSLLMPIKAVLMNLVSIGAAFGAVVWAFQDGHLAGILDFTQRPVEASNLVLILVLLFGLATDYEVFLLSRVREEWDLSGDNTRSVVVGLQRTGGIITAAALLLIVVVATFTTGGVSFLKLIGIGMTVAIFVDATLVRMVLVPATMKILGSANWWAPGPLRRFYAKYGIRESAGEAPVGEKEERTQALV